MWSLRSKWNLQSRWSLRSKWNLQSRWSLRSKWSLQRTASLQSREPHPCSERLQKLRECHPRQESLRQQ
jgi:hypothetical protein